LVEAGHRCAIPTCQHPAYEVAHIIPWAQCQAHEFENLIALCPNCHTRYDTGQGIDRLSMQMYKHNLGVLAGRYSQFERRVLDQLALSGQTEIRLPAGYTPLLHYLIRDGLLGRPRIDTSVGHATTNNGELIMGFEFYSLTQQGREFLASYAAARSLDGPAGDPKPAAQTRPTTFPSYGYYSNPPRSP